MKNETDVPSETFLGIEKEQISKSSVMTDQFFAHLLRISRKPSSYTNTTAFFERILLLRLNPELTVLRDSAVLK